MAPKEYLSQYKAPKHKELVEFAVFYKDWPAIRDWMTLHGVTWPVANADERVVLQKMFGKDLTQCTCLFLSRSEEFLRHWTEPCETPRDLADRVGKWLGKDASYIPVLPSVFSTPKLEPPVDLDF
jgi:hypothetical protein